MNYGLQVVNDSGAISLDSEYARLCVFHKGTYNSGASVVFQNVVDTQEPPLVFIRPPNNGSLIQLGVLLEGSAGAWTGATVTSGQVHSGNIFVAAFSSKPLSTYGLRMWGADGKQIFDSAVQAAVFTRVAQNWTFTHAEQSGQGLITNWYSVPLNYALGDYLMINNDNSQVVSNRQLECEMGTNEVYVRNFLKARPSDSFSSATMRLIVARWA